MDARIEELQKVAKSRSWLAAKEAFARLRFQLSVRQQMKYPERRSRGGVGVLLGGARRRLPLSANLSWGYVDAMPRITFPMIAILAQRGSGSIE